jgi:hypothetical protein
MKPLNEKTVIIIKEKVKMDIFPHVNLIIIGLWFVFFVIAPACFELKYSLLRNLRE